MAYNQLNLPVSFTKSGDTAITLTYVYDATGRKLQKINALTSDTTSYIDGIQYTNRHLDFIQTEEGRAINSGGTYSYEYDLKDHLGNVRFSFKENPITHLLDTLQRDDYYSPVILISAVFMSSPDRCRDRLCLRPKEGRKTGNQ